MKSASTLATLGALPVELIEIILPQLCQSDLTRCVRVSRSWYNALIPYLWQILALDSLSKAERFVTTEAQQALIKYAVFVRELHLAHEELYDRLLSPRRTFLCTIGLTTLLGQANATYLFTNLQSLELHAPRYPSRGQDHDIVALVRQNPGLRRLVINVDMDRKVLLNLVTEHMPNLQHLHLAATWRGNVRTLLENLPECIRTVRLRDVFHVSTDTRMPYTTSAKRHPALEFFHIEGPFLEPESAILAPFLRSCSQKLQTLRGLGAAFYVNPKVVAALLEIGFKWKVLHWPSLLLFESDAVVAAIITRSSHWTHITLDKGVVGPITAAAIVNHCEHLEVLDIIESGHHGLRGSHLQAVLSKARRLRSLQAHWLVDEDTMMTAMDILSSDWATTSLEHIDLKMAVVRVDEATSLDNTLVQSSHNIQRQVLRRLGQQRHLRRLVIGGMVRSADFSFRVQPNCLEMTLASGLDELVGLQQLQELDIHHMNHRVGVPELEWMAEHLPALQRLVGICDPGRPANPEVSWWLQAHRPRWR